MFVCAFFPPPGSVSESERITRMTTTTAHTSSTTTPTTTPMTTTEVSQYRRLNYNMQLIRTDENGVQNKNKPHQRHTLEHVSSSCHTHTQPHTSVSNSKTSRNRTGHLCRMHIYKYIIIYTMDVLFSQTHTQVRTLFKPMCTYKYYMIVLRPS